MSLRKDTQKKLTGFQGWLLCKETHSAEDLVQGFETGSHQLPAAQ